MEICWQKTIEKCLSGRYFLTVVGGAVFAYATYKHILGSEAVSAIVTAVFMSYFNRPDRNTNGGAK